MQHINLILYFLLGLVIFLGFQALTTDGFTPNCVYQTSKECGSLSSEPSDREKERYELCQTHNRNLEYINQNCGNFNKMVTQKMSEFDIPLTEKQKKLCKESFDECNTETKGERDCQEEYTLCLDVKRTEIVRKQLRDNLSPKPIDIDHTKCNYKLTLGGSTYEKSDDYTSFYEAPIKRNQTLDSSSLANYEDLKTEYDTELLKKIFNDTATNHSSVREYGNYEFKNVVGQNADPNYEPCEKKYMGEGENYKVIPSLNTIPCSDPSLPWHAPTSKLDERPYCGKSLQPCTYCSKFNTQKDPEIYQQPNYDTRLSAPNRYSHSLENQALCENPTKLQEMLSILPIHEAKMLKHQCERMNKINI